MHWNNENDFPKLKTFLHLTLPYMPIVQPIKLPIMLLSACTSTLYFTKLLYNTIGTQFNAFLERLIYQKHTKYDKKELSASILNVRSRYPSSCGKHFRELSFRLDYT